MEKPVQAEQQEGRQIPLRNAGRDADRTYSREAGELTAGKSRYCLQCTRTVNRHRWMRRES